MSQFRPLVVPAYPKQVRLIPVEQRVIEEIDDERYKQLQQELEEWRKKYFNLEAQFAKEHFDRDQVDLV